MALTRWTPTREITRRFNDFNRMFNSLLSGEDFDEMESRMTELGTWRPSVDVTEHEDEFVLSAEMPGLTEEDFDISIRDNVLTLKGEKKYTREDEDGNRYYSERGYGKFQRMIRLDSEINSDNVKADYENGVLTIHLPKTEETRSKEIPVNFKK